MSSKIVARVVLGTLGLIEGAAALSRFRERAASFEEAAERAAKLGRRLVVVGDPDAGFHTRFMRAYGCGDVCVDANGCPKCPLTVIADITNGPTSGIEDDSGVVFVSCVLEYVEDLEGALRELSRIAGSPENLFIVNVQPWTATAWLYPGARWRGDVSSDASAGEMKAVSPGEKLLVGGVLGLTLAAALWPGGSEP